MKFLTLFAATGAVAAIVPRDIQTVNDAIQSIQDGTTALGEGVNSFEDAGQAGALQQASSDLISTLEQANSDVEGSDDLSESDALTLTGPIGDLTQAVESTVDATIAKKSTFESAGVCTVVQSQLSEIKTGSDSFTETLLSKIPESLRGIGQQLAQPISDALDKAVEAYQNCEGGSSSSSGSESSTAAPTGSDSSVPYPTGSASATKSATEPAATYPAGTGGPTGGATSPVAPGPTGTAVTPPIATGAASNSAASFGAVAAAVLMVVAAF